MENIENKSENVVEEKKVEENSKGKKSKKKSVVGRIFKFILSLFLVIIVGLIGFFAFCAFDSKDVLDVIPRNYYFYVHTDSAVDTVESLVDLDAMDVILSSPEFVEYRETFLTYRASEIRDSSFFKFFANRCVDMAFYTTDEEGVLDFVAAVDLGWMSAGTRMGQYVCGFIPEDVAVITYEETPDFSYFIYHAETEEDSDFYFASSKNLVVASSSVALLKQSVTVEHKASYTEAEMALLNSADGNGLRIAADAHTLTSSLNDSQLLTDIAKGFDKNNLSVVNVNITNSDLFMDCRIPYAPNLDNPSKLDDFINKKSTVPSILNRAGSCVQYYTLLNCGSFEELKEVVFPLLPEEDDAEGTWKKADSACHMAFGLTLEELIFSWSGKEFGAFGIENQNDPVFVVQVKDEAQRQKIFEKFTASMFIKEENNLVINGARLTKLSMPAFITWILDIFDIDLPAPYFMVNDGFIYFSESAECLGMLYSDSMAGKNIVNNSIWQTVSQNMNNESSVSLYYNLERSVPFFMRKDAIVSDVLKLYAIGRFDMTMKGTEIEIKLRAQANKNAQSKSVPGFPINLKGKTDPSNFVIENADAPTYVFWVEDKKILKSLHLGKLQVDKIEFGDDCNIAANSVKNSQGLVWCVSSHGNVNLYDKEFKNCENFPVLLGQKTCAPCVSYDHGVLVPLENGRIAYVKDTGKVEYINICEEPLKASPFVKEEFASFYEKGFIGNIYTLDHGKCINDDDPMIVPEIGFGSPALIKTDKSLYTAFVVQSGKFFAWRNGQNVLSIQLDGLFVNGCQASDNYFYALSESGTLFRISTVGEVIKKKVPCSTAKNAYLSVSEHKGKKCVFVCADANMIYGYDENLELLNNFPVIGYGKPVFADVDGDKVEECISLTLNHKISAWKMR